MIGVENDRSRVAPAEFPLESAHPVEDEAEALPIPGEPGRAPSDDGPLPPPPRGRPLLWLGAGLGGMVVVGLALDTADLMTRAFAVGWGPGLAVVGLSIAAGLGLIGGLAREAAGLARLRSVERARADAVRARDGDEGVGGEAAARVVALYAGRSDLAAALARFRDEVDDTRDGGELVRLVEIELLSAIDRRAIKLVSRAARDTALVTALSRAALIDAAFVLWRNVRMIREVSTLYGARPGWIGTLRLTRGAVIGGAAAGATESAHGMAVDALGGSLTAAVSTRIGTGLVNGLMTARLGLAAMRLTRPVPFAAGRAPGLGPIRAELLKLPGDIES